jgi:hypothetical protein
MTVPEEFDGLRFACDCVSAGKGRYTEPWAAISKNRLLPNGRKEEILNLVALEPRTISQLAHELELAPPSVHTHVNEMMESELLRESKEWEKLHPKERYYEPNFPVVWADDRVEFEKICREMSAQFVQVFEKGQAKIEQAFNKTRLAEQGWQFADLAQYFYACIQRGARNRLEENGTLPPAEKHKNGVEWLFWAEEAETGPK